MGVSTNGQICFGILFEEGFEFPWDLEEFDGDIEKWWQSVNGFKHSKQIYDERGEYLNGVEPDKEDVERYYSEERDFIAKNALPIKLVNYCSGDYPMYIIATPSSCISSRRGYPEHIDPSAMSVTEEEKTALISFCEAHGIERDGDPDWYLSSLWN